MSGRRLGSRVRGAVRALLAFLFSNVGVVILLVGYTIAGAFMFQAIEGASEWERANNMSLERAKMADHLWRITLSLNPFNGSTLNDSISVELYRYQRRVVTAVRRGWDGGRSSRQWSFSSSFLYSLTVITTIGYGHLSPRTSWGKIVTIFYTLLGMPLFLLYLTNVGELLARWFKCLYALVCLCRGCPGFSRRRRLQLDFSEAESIERPEDWPSSITDHSSEYGRRHMALDHRIAPIHKIPGPRIPGYRIPDYTVPRHRIPGYRIQELRRMPLDHRLYRDERIPGYGDIELQQMPRKPVFTRSQSMPQPRRLPPSPQRAATALPAPENSRSSQFSIVSFDAQTITVPISVCVCILVGYIMFGSMLFGMWEKWDQLDGAYFCFISLSSIGFGDFVPGERVYTPRIETSFIACSFYLMLGMALVAMCFNLMQEQVIHYFAGLKRALKRICRCKR